MVKNLLSIKAPCDPNFSGQSKTMFNGHIEVKRTPFKLGWVEKKLIRSCPSLLSPLLHWTNSLTKGVPIFKRLQSSRGGELAHIAGHGV